MERSARWNSIAKRCDSSRTRCSSSSPRELGQQQHRILAARPEDALGLEPARAPHARRRALLVALLGEAERVDLEPRVAQRRHHHAELPLAAVHHQQVRQRLARPLRSAPLHHLAQAGVVVVGRRLADPVAAVVGLRRAGRPRRPRGSPPRACRGGSRRRSTRCAAAGARGAAAPASSSSAPSTLSRASSRCASPSSALAVAIPTSSRQGPALRRAQRHLAPGALAQQRLQRPVVVEAAPASAPRAGSSRPCSGA